MDPKMSFKDVPVANTEHASAAPPKATVLTLRLILSAEQTPASAPMITAAFAAIKQQGDEDERIVDSDVDVDSWNADRDARTDDSGDQRQQEKVAIDDSARKRVLRRRAH